MGTNGAKVLEEFLEAARELVASVERMTPVEQLPFKKGLERVNEVRKAIRHAQLALQFVHRFAQEDEAAHGAPPVAAGPSGPHPTQTQSSSSSPAGPGTSSTASARPSPRAASANPDRKDAFKGDTQTIPIAKLLSFLGMQQKTGVLEVEAPEEKISVLFDNGDVIEALSNRPPAGSRLGELLVSSEVLTEDDLERVLGELSSSNERLGAALERQGLVGPEELSAALGKQILGIIGRVTAARSAQFVFYDGLPAGVDRRIRIAITHLLLESARQRDESQLV